METGLSVTVLLAAIGTLWKVLHSQQRNTENRLQSKLDKCEKNHSGVNAQLLTMSSDLHYLKGRMHGHEEARADLGEFGRLSANVLNWMHRHDANQPADGSVGGGE